VADVFGPGTHKLTTQTLPVLTYLKNWDKLFQSPFKSDVYFFSTRQQVDQKWGTPQPITMRDKDFGAVRLRAFGNYAYRVADPRSSTPRSRARATSTPWPTWTASCAADLQNIATGIAQSGIPSWTWRPTSRPLRRPWPARWRPPCRPGPEAGGHDGAKHLAARGAAEGAGPEDRHGHGRRRHGQVHAVPDRAGHSRDGRGRGAGGDAGGLAGAGLGMGAGVAMGQVLAQSMQSALQGGAAQQRPARRRPRACGPRT
jgi:hypothetical protein